ncbi:MAG: YneF family protein [Anaeroplasmataceae bacterium]
MMQIWLGIVLCVGTLFIGLIIGFFITRTLFKRHLKKNPPVNENMIRAMFIQMGRTPSEKQVRQVMKSMDDAKSKPKTKK